MDLFKAVIIISIVTIIGVVFAGGIASHIRQINQISEAIVIANISESLDFSPAKTGYDIDPAHLFYVSKSCKLISGCGDNITNMSIFAYYNIPPPNMTSEKLIFNLSTSANATRYLSVPRNATILSAFINIIGFNWTDSDFDAIPNNYSGITDNCSFEYNPDQMNSDGDGDDYGGDVCDPCPAFPQPAISCPAQAYNTSYGVNAYPANETYMQNPDSLVQVIIPAGAVAHDTSVSMQKSLSTTDWDFRICTSRTTCLAEVGQMKYAFNPTINFSQPIDLKMSYLGGTAGQIANCAIDKLCDIFWCNESIAVCSNLAAVKPLAANCSSDYGWCVLNVTFGNEIRNF